MAISLRSKMLFVQLGVLFIPGFFVLGNHLLNGLTNIPEVISAANTYLPG